jgi:transcriptional regulator with XRE-family HTH domain
MANGEQLTLNHKERLLEELRDAAYRRGFTEGHATDTIALQLRMLRKAKKWEQRDVAERLGNPKLQPMISRYENPDYGRYSVSTLLELASVFDVALVVRFAPFSELVEWDWSSDQATLCPASFVNDQRLSQIAAEIRAEVECGAQAQAGRLAGVVPGSVHTIDQPNLGLQQPRALPAGSSCSESQTNQVRVV